MPSRTVTTIILVLPFLEDVVEIRHPFSRQQTDTVDHGANASSSESAPGEANEKNLILRFIVVHNECISLPNVLRQPGSCAATIEMIQ